MGIIEQIIKMKNQGTPDNEIVSALQQQGISPREINDALNQAQIKNAVASDEEMQPSIMEQEPPKPIKEYKNREVPGGVYTPQPNYPQPEYYEQSYPQQENYPQETYETYAPSYDSETMIEIAEQVFMEKIKKIEKQVDEINEFKTLAQVKIDNISDRLKRIETTIDNLQISILDKVGSYGKNLETTKKEMVMMQDSFRKITNTPHKKETSEFIPTKKISKPKRAGKSV